MRQGQNNSDEIRKYRRELYSKFFLDLAKMVFAAFVIGIGMTMFSGSSYSGITFGDYI
ncbi:hypothetical protein Barb7_00796 [Bacteroidales bacterium Barb7]|nr:hypothetical protein Barb4_02569 [Bacteroidales bacterium Barb4]OAV74093.1 hypothetical protein Barb7_02455 [Bacteroidales bacterium Barb7]OAV75584.1 hypothetical protein Barb7_00796 [Bacteroidales bacterium Barb7]